MSNPGQRPVRVGMISLGCAKNLVDGEIMLGSLLKGGIEITNQADQADVLIVNTCSFIGAAQKESVDAILQAAEARNQNNPAQGLIVSGCLPQRYREELPKLLPEVDAFMGVDQVAQVAQIVGEVMQRRRDLQPKLASAKRASRKAKSARRPALPAAPAGPAPAAAPAPLVEVHQRPDYIPDYATPRFRLTPAHFAYLKIAEGCNHPCSFCIIPRMRGAHRSRQPDDLLREARQLLASGVKELNLISQDSTYYGLDLRTERAGPIAAPAKFQAAARALPAGAASLSALLRGLNALPGQFWVRLLYTHPAHWTDELIETIAQCPKVARYIDMPLQHIHETMLERMRRETSRQYIVDLLAKIRAGISGVAIRTTFIVGFPGETDACFDSLLQFITDAKFERLGVFTYSRQEGTRAGVMERQVPERVKSQRQKLAMAAQLKVSRQVAASFVGREIPVLVEGRSQLGGENGPAAQSWEHGLIRAASAKAAPPKDGHERDEQLMVARGEADAPDIDGRVYVRGRLPVGQFARVRITGHTDYDLLAEPAG